LAANQKYLATITPASTYDAALYALKGYLFFLVFLPAPGLVLLPIWRGVTPGFGGFFGCATLGLGHIVLLRWGASANVPPQDLFSMSPILA